MSTDQHSASSPAAPSPDPTDASATATGAVSGSIRASDAEREAVVCALHDALGEGRLDLDETDGRVAAAYAARHRDELPPLLADLPASSGGRDVAAGTSTLGRGAVALIVGLVVAWLLLCGVAGAVAGTF